MSAVDGAVLLVQRRRNPQSMVLRAQQIVESLKPPLIGVVFNQVPANAGGDYGYYTDNYAYCSEGAERRNSRREARVAKSEATEKDRRILREPHRE